MAIRTRSMEEGSAERVKPLELFFDRIFVFVLTQVTGLVAAQPTWQGLAVGTAVLGVIWWAWTAYAWLTNTIDPDEGYVRLAMFAAMRAMLVVSLAVPGSFADNAVLFVVAYAFVRAGQLVLYAIAGQGDSELLGAITRLAIGSTAGIALLFVAATQDGWWQIGLWYVAIGVDMLGALIGGGRGWRLSPGHFAERHGLVLIIALGESIVVARDSYSYLHLPLVLGIVLFAVGVKKTLAHVGDPLKPVPAVCLCCGIALYLLAHVGFRLRNVRSVNRQRLVVAAVLVGLTPVATSLPALASLAIVAGLIVALIAFEAVFYAEARDRIRHAV